MDRELDRWREELEWLRALAIRLVRDPERADELAQETALISLRRSPELDPGERSWRVGVLKKLITNRARDLARRRRRESHATPPSAPPAPGDLVEQLEVHHQITEAILALDEPHREVVILRYFHERTSAEIARETGEPEATVRSRLQRALARLRTDLDRRFGGDRRKWAAPLVAWISLSAGGAGIGEAGQGSDAAGRWPDATPASAPPPASLPPLSPTAIGGALVSAKKAMVAAAAVLVVTGIGWFAARSSGRNEQAPLSVSDPVAAVESTGAAVAAIEDSTPPPGGAQAVVIRGEARDRHTDDPIAGARAEVIAREPAQTIAGATSGANGAFAIEVAADATVTGADLRVTARGRLPATLPLRGDPRRWPTWVSTIHLEAGIEVAGRVVDIEGRPEAVAEVAAYGGITARVYEGGHLSHGARIVTPWEACDANGRFFVTLPRGEAMLVARAANSSGSVTVLVAGPNDEEVVVTLRDDFPILGRVVDAVGEPVVGAAIAGHRQQKFGDTDLPFVSGDGVSSRTDAHGEFRFPSHGYSYTLRVQHPEHLAWPVGSGWKDADFLPGREKTISLERGRALHGSLIVPGEIEDTNRSFGLVLDIGDIVRSTIAEDGSIVGTRVPTTSGGGTLSIPGTLPRELHWPPGDSDIDLGVVELEAGATLAVTVTDPDGEPAAGAGVRASRADSSGGAGSDPEARTGGDGVAQLRGCAPGETRVLVWRNGSGTVSQSVSIPAEGTSIAIRLEPSGELRGRWVDSLGEPQPGVAVRLLRDSTPPGGWFPSEIEFPDGPSGLFEDSTRPDGAFRFPTVPCGVPLRCEISGAGWLPVSLPIEPLKPGERRGLGDLAGASGSTLRVTVTELSGEPLPGAEIELRPATGDSGIRLVQRGDVGGGTLFQGLGSGSYNLHVRANARVARETTVELRAAEESISIALDRGETWAVRVVDPDGGPIEGANVDFWAGSSYPAATARTNAAGEAVVDAIPPRPRHYAVTADGHFDLRADDVTGDLPREVVLERTASLEVRFEIPAWGPPVLGGTVTVRSGTTIHNHRVFPGDEVTHLDGLAPGTAPVEVTIDGYTRVDATVELRAGETAVFVVRPTALAEVVTVAVVDARGVPVNDAAVVISACDSPPFPGYGKRAELRHIGEGRYSAPLAVRAPLYDVVVTAPGHAPALLERVTLDREERIPLEEGAGIDLVVLEADGSPAAWRDVTARLHSQHSLFHSEIESPRVKTDAEGRLELRGLAAARYTILVLRDGATLAWTDCDLAPGVIAPIEMRLSQRLEIRGTVAWGGRPVIGELMELRAGTEEIPCRLDGSGRFVASVPEVETITCDVRLPGGHIARFSGVQVRAGTEIELSCDPVGAELRFIGPDGKPFGPFAGWLSPMGAGPVGGTFRFVADAEGLASVRDLPAGWYSVGATLEGGFVLLDEEIEAGPERWVLRIGRSGTLRVRLIEKPGGVEYIDGYRCDSAGTFRDLPWPTTYHRELNEMRIPVPLGKEGTIVILDCPGRAPLILDLEGGPPDEAVEIPDLPGGRLSLRKKDGGDAGLGELRVESLDGTALSPVLARRIWRGNYLTHSLPTGRYGVSVTGPSGAITSTTVEIRRGETTTLEY